MSTEKESSEQAFEEFYLKEQYPDKTRRDLGFIFSKDEDGNYLNPYTLSYWRHWKAGRASRELKLPELRDVLFYCMHDESLKKAITDDVINFYNWLKDQVKSLNEVGG